MTTASERFFKVLDLLCDEGRIKIQPFCKDAGILSVTLYRYKAKREAKPEWMTYIVEHYGVSSDWLLTGQGRMFKR